MGGQILHRYMFLGSSATAFLTARAVKQELELSLIHIFIRPPLETADCALVTACAGVAVCDAVEELAGRRPSIKWTNDPQFDGKKLCRCV